MASEYTMMDPIRPVENQNNQLTVNPTALEILDKMSQPVVVVAIAGLYWTGKSYLMNRLEGQNHGFCLGSTVRSETKGIWMWCVPHPSKPNHTLVLLDIEGLGDVEKGDSKNDSWLFALAVLLSSMFVYNSMSTINHQALEQLQCPSRNPTSMCHGGYGNVEELLRKHQEEEMQHEIEVQRIKAESEATTRKILAEVQKKNEQRWEETEKNYQEYVKRLEEMEKERAEEARNAKHKLQESERKIERLLEKNKKL